jgi:hypothetical protein
MAKKDEKKTVFRRIKGRIVPISIGVGSVGVGIGIQISKHGFSLSKRAASVSDTLPSGVFLKRSDKNIGLRGKTQIKVLDLSGKTKEIANRSFFESYIGKDRKIKKKIFEEKRMNQSMQKKFDKIWKKKRRIRKSGINLSKSGKMSRVLNAIKRKHKLLRAGKVGLIAAGIGATGYGIFKRVKNNGF